MLPKLAEEDMDVLRNIIAFMPKRSADVRAAKGGDTKWWVEFRRSVSSCAKTLRTVYPVHHYR